MNRQILIGESGGSKTDWVLLENEEVKWKFSSGSLHPNNWKKDIFDILFSEFRNKKVDFQHTKLLIFGAGCNGAKKAEVLKNYFKLFGFKELEISGDLRAAGIATYGDLSGFVAILGSGSVLVDFQQGRVSKFFGGFGRELGDEGAGFYFGKLVLEAYSRKELEPIQSSILKSVLTFQEASSLNRNEISDKLCLELSKKLGENLMEFQNFHFQNIDLFYTKYVEMNVSKGETLSFVGSYAYYHQEIIKSYFRAKGIELGRFIARPMDNIVSFYQTKGLNKP